MDCKASRKIWQLAPPAIQLSQAHNKEFFSVVHELNSSIFTTEAELMVVYCWVIWSARNKFIFQGKITDARIAAAEAEAALKAFQRVRKSDAGLETKVKGAVQQHWKPPPPNVLKINTDAAVHSLDQKSGLGAIIRDAEGKILTAGTKQVQLREGVSSAEAEAVLWGLTVAKQVCSSSVIIESDCQEVVELLNNTKGSRTEIQWIVADILRLCEDFQHVQFSYISRNCNTHAHALAKFALRNCSANAWVDPIPAEVQHVLNRVVV